MKKINTETIDLSAFKHRIKGKVEFYEADSFGVVHNVRYLYWFERARIEYMASVGLAMKAETFISDVPMLVVHTEADYLRPLKFNDEYTLLTRVKKANKSSIEFENIALGTDDKIACVGSAVLVHLNKESHLPEELPETFRNSIVKYEGSTPE